MKYIKSVNKWHRTNGACNTSYGRSGYILACNDNVVDAMMPKSNDDSDDGIPYCSLCQLPDDKLAVIKNKLSK